MVSASTASVTAADTDPGALLNAAAQRLAKGGLVAFPTETVYGLGARADDDRAVAAIFEAKGRPANHPLIVHLETAAQATEFASSLSVDAQRLAQHFWPGPLTLVVPRRPDRGAAAAGGQNSIGLRVPSHPMARALLRQAAALGVVGVAAPSANRFGRVSPTRAEHVRQEFGPGLMVLDGGPCEVGIESSIVDCTGAVPALLRPGQLSVQSLEQVLGRPLAAAGASSPRVSGSLESHYAPTTPLRLWSSAALTQTMAAGPPVGGARVAVYSRVILGHAASAVPLEAASEAAPVALAGWLCWPMAQDPASVAHELFAVLRHLDSLGAAAIWVEEVPVGAAWDGVRDRLQRAAA